MAGLKIEELRKPDAGGMYYSDVEICVDKDGNLVPAGSVRSAWMLVGAGSCIPARLAEKYGLIQADAPVVQPPQDAGASAAEPESEPEPEPEEKAQEPEEDKQIIPAANKRRRTR